MFFFFVIFVLIPLMEISVFLLVGEEIGVMNTLLLCLLTAVTGGLLVKWQGLETLLKGQKVLSRGQLPIEELFDGVCIVAAGAMLITPGFVTDVIGFLLLFPLFRRAVRRYLTGRFGLGSTEESFMREHRPGIDNLGDGNAYRGHRSDPIEGEYEKIDPEND